MSLLRALTSLTGRVVDATLGVTGAVVSLVAMPVYVLYPLIAGAAAAIILAVNPEGTDPLPVPDPIVGVETRSGTVRTTNYVPIGGVPVAIDVDGDGVTNPDLLVSIGLVSLDQLPQKPVVPNLIIQRAPAAVVAGRAAPPVSIDAEIVLRDIAGGREIARVTGGYETTAASRIPPKVSVQLLGPLSGGFVDPLLAQIETPGFEGPLRFRVGAKTAQGETKANFTMDPVPPTILLTRRQDGNSETLRYEHSGTTDEVAFDADVESRIAPGADLVRATAHVDRLPSVLELTRIEDGDRSLYDFATSPTTPKPDVRASYRATSASGATTLDADFKLAGLPSALRAEIESDGDRTGDVSFAAAGGKVDSLDFLVRNHDGDSGGLPEPSLGPDLFVAASSRTLPGGDVRYRAAGHLEDVRAAGYARSGGDGRGYRLVSDMGEGAKPLRVLADLDSRGAGEDESRIRVDGRLDPLPATLDARFEPGTGSESSTIAYTAPQPFDATASVQIATGPGSDCGAALVTCLDSRITDVPANTTLSVPGQGARDYSVSYDEAGGARPDVHATIDSTPADAARRSWAKVDLTGVPATVHGRLGVENGVPLQAEFHACDYDFDDDECNGPQDRLDSVDFMVRGRPERSGLPTAPATAETYITMLERRTNLELRGHVEEIRNVAFRQRDANDDGRADGTIGVQIDAGDSNPFDLRIDRVDPDPLDAASDAVGKVSLHIPSVPQRMDGCVRLPAVAEPPDELGADALLSPCDRTDVLGGDLPSTPLSFEYRASAPMEVQTEVSSTRIDPGDGNRRRTDSYDATIADVPARVRGDALVPTSEHPLHVRYQAHDREGEPAGIDRVTTALQARRSDSVCRDPRGGRRATCFDATFTDVPAELGVSFAPDLQEDGRFSVDSSEPRSGEPRPSIAGLHLSSTTPDRGSIPVTLDGDVDGLTPRLSGRIARIDPVNAGRPELGEVAFDACTDGDGDRRCNGQAPYGNGIGRLDLRATSSRVGDPLALEVPAGLAGVDQQLSYLTRGVGYRAKVDIVGFRAAAASARR